MKAHNLVVVDSITRIPLPKASIYNKNGKIIGVSNSKGLLTNVISTDYPIKIKYVGYNDKIVDLTEIGNNRVCDTILLCERVAVLPEVIVKSKNARVLHILAYVREWSSLSTYTDTVFLFREKMVDYMLPSDNKVKFRGWTNPRTLTCKSYYRFTNIEGLDSVSDECNNHFSWVDWMGLPPSVLLPERLRLSKVAVDTLKGRYFAIEAWNKSNDSIGVEVNVIEDTIGRKWVPHFQGFFKKNVDFEKFDAEFVFENIQGDMLSPLELTKYSFDIESRGRGRDMFRFNKYYEPVFVSTKADVYMLDKEFIPIKEAKEWILRKYSIEDIGIFEPEGLLALPKETQELIERVDGINKGEIRVKIEPDQRLVGIKSGRNNFTIGRRALDLLKILTGISAYKSRKNFKKNWNNLRKKVKR